jgi:hypothetical protein
LESWQPLESTPPGVAIAGTLKRQNAATNAKNIGFEAANLIAELRDILEPLFLKLPNPTAFAVHISLVHEKLCTSLLPTHTFKVFKPTIDKS